MEKIRTFDMTYLEETKKALESAFRRESSNESYNEWEFAETVLKSDGYIPELCLTALEDGKVVGYSALTAAAVGVNPGLALGPLGVAKEYQGRGIGSHLVRESIQRAKMAGYSWIILLGGDYYQRFVFEKGQRYGIYLSDNAFENEHIQILFLDPFMRSEVSGKVTYCSAFYDEEGNLL